MIFVWWALWFCAWTFGTLVGLNARASAGRPNFDIDGQQVAIMALSGLFFIFVFALFAAHVDLICAGQSTVETLDARRIREREDRVLKRLHAWSDFRGKRATRRQWDAEWGRVGKEGSPWWLGSARRNWEATMGARVWEWFCKYPLFHLCCSSRATLTREGYSADREEPRRRAELHAEPAVRRGGPVAAETRVAEGAAIATYQWGGRAHDCTTTYTIDIGYTLLLKVAPLGDVLAVDCFAATDWRIMLYKRGYCSAYCFFYCSNKTRDTATRPYDAAMSWLSPPASALAPPPS